MDEETKARFASLLNKAAADIIADWNWPVWRVDEGRADDDEQPPHGE